MCRKISRHFRDFGPISGTLPEVIHGLVPGTLVNAGSETRRFMVGADSRRA